MSNGSSWSTELVVMCSHDRNLSKQNAGRCVRYKVAPLCSTANLRGIVGMQAGSRRRKIEMARVQFRVSPMCRLEGEREKSRGKDVSSSLNRVRLSAQHNNTFPGGGASSAICGTGRAVRATRPRPGTNLQPGDGPGPDSRVKGWRRGVAEGFNPHAKRQHVWAGPAAPAAPPDSDVICVFSPDQRQVTLISGFHTPLPSTTPPRQHSDAMSQSHETC
ncbi:hypothetical protein AOLI_G00081430 [Acnodon oligacanthus]